MGTKSKREAKKSVKKAKGSSEKVKTSSGNTESSSKKAESSSKKAEASGKKTKASNKKTKHIPYQYKPEGLDLKTWQQLLRKQAAQESDFMISSVDEENAPGEYHVTNPLKHETYKVVYRGAKSPWNYCSCMDFKTSQLGTCKHLEAVKMWVGHKGHYVHREIPPYTSVYIDYSEGRKVRIRIGNDHKREFEKLVKEYFTNGELNANGTLHFEQFLASAKKIDDTFRCYNDALEYVLEKREHHERSLWVDGLKDEVFSQLLQTRLYDYQKEGIRFAAKAGRAIIADEMGLGKTVQAIGTAQLLKSKGLVDSVLIICPTSLKYQWKREIERFTGEKVRVIEGIQLKRRDQYFEDEPYKIVSYNAVTNDIKTWGHLRTDMLIIDEVQRLKNWDTQIARAARKIDSHYAVILSGTPLENKLEELYSVVELVDQFLLGPFYLFRDRYIVKDDKGATIGYRNLNELGERLKAVLVRRRKRDVRLQLPKRQDKNLMMPMTKEQMAVHDEAKWSVGRLIQKWDRMHFLSETDRRRLMMYLQQMRCVCDSTYILDQKTRYDTKVDETVNIIRNVIEGGDEKVVVFSQWERMTRIIAQELEKHDIRFEYLHGSVPSKARKDLVNNFTDLPESRVFLSTDAGSTGLNLQAASVIINVDLPWNPAVLEQRVARIYRIGQERNIEVINLVAANTFEESMLAKLKFKTSMFEGVLDGGEDSIFASNNKFSKIMDDLKETMETPLSSGEEPVEDSEKEKSSTVSADTENTDTRQKESPSEKEDDKNVQSASQPSSDKIAAKDHSTADAAQRKARAKKLISDGVSFLSGLASALKTEESTRELVDSLVEKNKDTGETSLKIPVPDKDTVVQVLGLLGKLFQGK